MSEEKQIYTLDDTTIAGLMQLLTLAIATGTNLMDHLQLLELQPTESGALEMTPNFIEKTERLAHQLVQKMEDSTDGPSEDFGFFEG